MRVKIDLNELIETELERKRVLAAQYLDNITTLQKELEEEERKLLQLLNRYGFQMLNAVVTIKAHSA